MSRQVERALKKIKRKNSRQDCVLGNLFLKTRRKWTEKAGSTRQQNLQNLRIAKSCSQ